MFHVQPGSHPGGPRSCVRASGDFLAYDSLSPRDKVLGLVVYFPDRRAAGKSDEEVTRRREGGDHALLPGVALHSLFTSPHRCHR